MAWGFVASIVVSLVIAAASLVISELLKPKPDLEDAKPAGIGDFRFPTAIEGRPVPIAFGRVKIEGPNVVWWGDLRARAIRKTIKTGLWSSDRITTGYRYDVGVQLALCAGPIDALNRIWIGDTVVATGSVQDGTYDVDLPKLFGGDEFGNGGMEGTFRVHSGSSTQAANSYLSGFQNPIAPHRGTCHVVWEGGYIGNSTSIKPWRFELERYPNGLGLTGGNEQVGFEANPAAVIYELLTDTDWGFGFAAADIDVAGFRVAGNTLASEGNGFSMLLDRRVDALQLLELLQDQIDGLVFLDQETGQFKLGLARDDYDVDLVPQLTADKLIEVREFSRGTWEETSNQVRIKFADRDRDYFETFAQAHDLGNQAIQGGEIVSEELTYPGVKDKTLANTLAGRELRQRAIPLAKATVTVDRSFWNLKPNDVIAWTDANYGFVKLPMRVARIDFGDLVDGRITISLVQDVFKVSAAFFGEPDSTRWTAPTQDVGDLPEALVIEAPRAISVRDPDTPQVLDRLWAGARRNTGGEVTCKIWQRNASGTPSGDYTEDSEHIGQFLLLGKLRNAVAPGAQGGAATLQLDPDPDALADLQAAFTASPSQAEIGVNLQNLCFIEGTETAEFIAVTSVVNQTTHLDLQNVWRGMLDTLPGNHSAGDKVYLMFVGGGLSLTDIPRGNNVDAQVRAESFTDESTEGESTVYALTMQDRHRRPYPPAKVAMNGTELDASVDLDDLKAGGSDLDERGLELTFNRRDFRRLHEVQSIQNDAATLDPGFPSEDTHQVQATLFDEDSLTTGLLSFWKLEESSGTRVDSGPLGLDLSDINTVTSATGLLGTAASFNSSNNEHLISSANPPELNFGDQAFTWACWVKLNTNASTSDFMSLWDVQAGDHKKIIVRYNSFSNRYRVQYSGDGSTTNILDANNHGAPGTGNWDLVVVQYDPATDTISLQVNNGTADTASFAGGLFRTATPRFMLGGFTNPTGDVGTMDGEIDAVGIWGRKLTAAELTALYNSGNGQQVPFALHDRQLDQEAWGDFADRHFTRTKIARAGGGHLPTDIRLDLDTRHTFEGEVLEALNQLSHQMDIDASTLDDDTVLGVLTQNAIGFAYTAPDTGTYQFEIGTALSTGAVQARINGGGFSTVISAGNTTGSLGSVTAGDTIEIRHTEGSISGETFLQVDAPTSTTGAYGVLI